MAAVAAVQALRPLPPDCVRRVLTYVRAGNVRFAAFDALRGEIRVDAGDVLFHFDHTFEDVGVLMETHSWRRIVVRATFENGFF